MNSSLMELNNDVVEFANKLDKNRYVNLPDIARKRLAIKDTLAWRTEAKKVCTSSYAFDCVFERFILKFWNLLQKEGDTLSAEQYILLNLRISRALLPNFEQEEAQLAAQVTISASFFHTAPPSLFFHFCK